MVIRMDPTALRLRRVATRLTFAGPIGRNLPTANCDPSCFRRHTKAGGWRPAVPVPVTTRKIWKVYRMLACAVERGKRPGEVFSLVSKIPTRNFHLGRAGLEVPH